MVKRRAKGRRTGGVLKRPRILLAVAVPIAIPLFLASVRAQPELGGPVQASLTPGIHMRYAELARPQQADLPEHSLILTVEKNDTLDKILGAGGLPRGESATLTAELAKSIDVRRLRPGQLVRFHYDRGGAVDSVQMKVTGWGELNAVRNGNAFSVTTQQAVIREVETDVSATIDRSLYEALREQGEGPQLVQQLVDVFQWDIDFFELQKGDSFSLVVTKQYSGADLLGYGPVKAARFTHRGTMYEAFRHESDDGHGGYYASGGTPLRKQFLKAPLKFTRITSGFTKKRFHPVLKYFRPHNGIDYGAPIGTPVMTTADGVVVEARYKPGEGNFIRVRHSSRYDTCYLHLSRFAKGLKKGSRVTQGDVIGYVGMTGLATGPHLDYRVSENGKWLNPLQLKSITPDPLRGGSLTRFHANVARLLPRLAATSPVVAEKQVQQRALF
ncbi:MAG TPA: peptidoglycan DD-metalloendopeptidase family protein [Thermoanaerobaculia bacterium]|nr:peptidoglycan DD-metalloendopeptidase family protein [Thermoanaerobaculia bacterium]